MGPVVGPEVVGRREQVALRVAAGVVGQPDRVGVGEHLLVGRPAEVGLLRQDVEDVGDAEPLGDRDGVLQDVRGVDQDRQRVGGRHLLLELVVADLDRVGLGLVGRGGGERVDRLHHALRLEVATHLGDRVARLDLEDDLAAGRPGEVARGGEAVLEQVDAHRGHVVEPAEEHRQGRQRGEAPGDAAQPALAPAPAALRGFVEHHLLRLGRGVVDVVVALVVPLDELVVVPLVVPGVTGVPALPDVSHPLPRRSLLAQPPCCARCPMRAAG